jgi:excinuclease ABC subunit B
VDGLVIFYADKITVSMQRTMDETGRRRAKQVAYNEEHGITPTTISKSVEQIMKQTSVLDIKGYDEKSPYATVEEIPALIAAEDDVAYLSKPELEKVIAKTKKAMEKAAKDLDFMEAARLRDQMFGYQKMLGELN